MPRIKAKTTNKASWNIGALTEAIEAVKNGVVGVREATRRCDVPYSSLRDRIRAMFPSKVRKKNNNQ
jgi:hypothetical protein